MKCKNHPNVEAVERCAGCAEPFCGDCLVEMKGQKYCGDCKGLAIKDMPIVEGATMPCAEAGEALKYAIIGIFCFGFILGPIAISKALKAKKMIEKNPRLTGSGKATAAIIIGIVDIVGSIIGILVKIGKI